MKRNNFRVLNRVKIVEMRSEALKKRINIENKDIWGLDKVKERMSHYF